MKLNRLFCGGLAGLIALAIFAEPAASGPPGALTNAVILVVRHAEKPAAGAGLSAAGEARARAYVHYFKNFKVEGQPVQLDYLFAAADSKSSRRPRLTLEPLSQSLGLPIDCRFKHQDFQELVNEIRFKPHGRALLIAWHHGEIPALLAALGADPKLVIPPGKWPNPEFGWLIQLRYDSAGHLIEAKRIAEGLMPGNAAQSAK